MAKKVLGVFFFFILFISAYGGGQDASGIIVPSGFYVEKVLDVDKCQDPYRIAFLPSGDLLLTSQMWRIHQITPTGTVMNRIKFLTNNGPVPFDILVTPGGEIYFSNIDTNNNPGLYRLDNDQPVLVTPGDEPVGLLGHGQHRGRRFAETRAVPLPRQEAGVVSLPPVDQV